MTLAAQTGAACGAPTSDLESGQARGPAPTKIRLPEWGRAYCHTPLRSGRTRRCAPTGIGQPQGVAPTSDEEPLTLPSPSRGEGLLVAGYVPPFICASTKSSYSNSTPQTVQAIGSPGGGGKTSSLCLTPRQTREEGPRACPSSWASAHTRR